MKMDKHNINVELTIGLMDNRSQEHILIRVKRILENLDNQVGKYIDLKLVSKHEILTGLVNRVYNLVYENCVISLDYVMTNRGEFYINRFKIEERENISLRMAC